MSAMGMELTISPATNGALLKGHDVLGESARLVWEDVLDLAQLLIEGGGARLGWGVLVLVVHLQVPVDKFTLAQTDDLHTAQPGNKPMSQLVVTKKSILLPYFTYFTEK